MVVEGRFLGQTVKTGSLLGRIELKMAAGRIPVDQSHIRMGIIFLGLGLFELIRSLVR